MLLAAWYHPLLAVLFSFLAVILMVVILLQRGKGVGLAGAFGGAGGHTAFGAKTGDVLTWLTVALAGALLLTAVLLNYAFVPFTAPGASAISAPGQQTQQAPADNAGRNPASSNQQKSAAPSKTSDKSQPASPQNQPKPAPAPAGEKTAPGGGSAPVPFGMDDGPVNH